MPFPIPAAERPVTMSLATIVLALTGELLGAAVCGGFVAFIVSGIPSGVAP